jgi:hypothetical protein
VRLSWEPTHRRGDNQDDEDDRPSTMMSAHTRQSNA